MKHFKIMRKWHKKLGIEICRQATHFPWSCHILQQTKSVSQSSLSQAISSSNILIDHWRLIGWTIIRNLYINKSDNLLIDMVNYFFFLGPLIWVNVSLPLFKLQVFPSGPMRLTVKNTRGGVQGEVNSTVTFLPQYIFVRMTDKFRTPW